MRVFAILLLASAWFQSEGKELNGGYKFKIGWDSPFDRSDKSQDSGQGRASLFSGNDTIVSYSPRDFIFNSCQLQKYQAPYSLQKIFPYYHSGFDEDGRPIWVAEFGKYNLRKISSGNKELQVAFDDYTNDITYQIMKSLFHDSKPGRPNFEFIFMVDFEGFSAEQVTFGNVQILIKMARRYTRMIDEYAKEVIVINTNFLAEQLVNILRPAFGKLFEKIKIFGTNKEKWLPYLRKELPKKSLAEWYGGYKDFEPLSIHGR